MPGSITLAGGDPRVGKSTLLLQAARSAAGAAARLPVCPGVGMGPPPTAAVPLTAKVLYVSGEENAGQIASRALRLGISDPELLLWCETDAKAIVRGVIDSVAAAEATSSLSSSSLLLQDWCIVGGGIGAQAHGMARRGAAARLSLRWSGGGRGKGSSSSLQGKKKNAGWGKMKCTMSPSCIGLLS
jgi:hypothetical protein